MLMVRDVWRGNKYFAQECTHHSVRGSGGLAHCIDHCRSRRLSVYVLERPVPVVVRGLGLAQPPLGWPTPCSRPAHEGRPGAGAVALGRRRIPLRQRVAYGTIPAKDVPHRLSLRAGGGSGADKGVTVVQQGLAVRRMGA